jgi:hypothetical protein
MHTWGWAGHAVTVYITGTGLVHYASCMEAFGDSKPSQAAAAGVVLEGSGV